ncbi:uncharacterized protein [Myotis yumanensis]|uniref:uncharacterized protein isoform X1 n=1 Tax=Myotis yumanensis TaxID=159337 RepID=UPI0038D4CB5D
MRHPHGDLWTLRTAAAARGGAAEHPGVTVSLESWEKKFNNSELVVSEVPLPNITRAWREAFPDCMAALREQRDFYIQHSQTSRRSASCPLKADDSASKSRGWQADYETGCTVRNAVYTAPPSCPHSGQTNLIHPYCPGGLDYRRGASCQLDSELRTLSLLSSQRNLEIVLGLAPGAPWIKTAFPDSPSISDCFPLLGIAFPIK